MKKFFLILGMILSVFICQATTPTLFTFQFQNADGTYNTNYTTMQGWPPATGGATVVSNVIVWSGAGQIITNQFQGTNTLGTNSAMPNNYKVFCPATSLGFFVTIPQTTNMLPLANYATGLTVTYPSSSLFYYITNALGGTPAIASYSSIVTALGFIPATNGGTLAYSQLPYAPGITNGNGVSLTNIPNMALQFVAATNGAALVYSKLPFTPPTNTFAGIVSVLGFNPATNNPATNTIIYLTGATGQTNSSGVVTNIVTTSGTNTINYQHQ